MHYLPVGNMKVKDVTRTANIAWSPAPQYPIYLAAGTAAQQLDATFRYIMIILYILGCHLSTLYSWFATDVIAAMLDGR